jgi:hypothetical protein
MSDSISRRDFHKLTSAALGGMMAGTVIGCSSNVKEAKAAAVEVHACRGLNACKEQGADKKNDCAGQGSCSTAKEHACAGQNDCKHQGGCGEAPGLNDCKTKGGCSVPMKGDMWEKARAHFEEQMKKDGKQFGVAPMAASA